MTTPTRSGHLRLAAAVLACLVLPVVSLGAQDRARDVQAKDRAAKQEPNQAERALKAALKEMTDTQKLSSEQAGELYRIVFTGEENEEARFEAYLEKNPKIAKALARGNISKDQALAGFRARAGEAGPSEEQLLDAAHAQLIEEEPTLGRTSRKALLPRLKQMIAEGKVQRAPSQPSTKQRSMTFGLYCNDLIESGQVERFDLGLKKVLDIATAEIDRQGTRVQVTGSIRDLSFAVYEVQADWSQVLGKTLLLSEEKPIARGRGEAGQLDLELRHGVLPRGGQQGTFAMRFEGRLPVLHTGEYTFRLSADDQAQLFVDRKLVCSFLNNAVGEPTTARIALEEGAHEIRVDFADWGGAWWLDLVMIEPGGQELMLSTAHRGFDRERMVKRRGREKTKRRVAQTVDWKAEYERFLADNPRVEQAVDAGRITKAQVLAGIKARAEESKPQGDARELELLLERLERLEPGAAGPVRAQFERGEIGLEEIRGWLTEADDHKRDEGRKREEVDRRGKGDERLAKDPKSAWAAAERALKGALAEMTDAKKLEAEQASELHALIFPQPKDGKAHFEAYLNQNPEIAAAVKSGKISLEQAFAGFRARIAEEGHSEKELLDAAYLKLIEEHPELGRTAREKLMPRLKQIVAQGRLKAAKSKPNTKQRTMTFGLYLNDLIETGQIERFDEGLKKVHDIGVAEIARQGAADAQKKAGQDTREKQQPKKRGSVR